MTAPPAGALEACLALLPCPFCGEAPEGPVQIASKVWKVSCARNLRHDAHAMSWESADDAIAAWNRRTHGPALLAALRLREECSANTLKTLWMSADALESAAKCVGGDLAVVLNDRAMFARIARDDLARVLEEGE